MINVILPVVEEPEKFAEFAQKFSGPNVKIFVGVRKGLSFDLNKENQEFATENVQNLQNVETGKTQKMNGRKSAKPKKNSMNFNIEVHTFAENSNSEEIINALHSTKMEKGKVLICRRPLTEEEFLKLTNSQKDIVALKAKHSKFFSALKNLAKKIIKRFFAFTYSSKLPCLSKWSGLMFKTQPISTRKCLLVSS